MTARAASLHCYSFSMSLAGEQGGDDMYSHGCWVIIAFAAHIVPIDIYFRLLPFLQKMITSLCTANLVALSIKLWCLFHMGRIGKGLSGVSKSRLK